MTRVFVTGATGAVGACLVPLLLERGCEVLALVRGTSRVSGSSLGLQIVQGDLRNQLQLPVDRLDAVIHIAAEVPGANVVNSAEKAEAYREVNDGGTRRVIELAKRLGASRLIYVSSHAVLLHAEDECSQLFPYASSKKRGEDHVSLSDLDWTIFRPLGIYGKGEYWKGYFRSIRRKRFVRIYGSGTQLRQYLFAEDMARVLADSLDNAQTHRKTYNLAGVPFTLEQYLRTIRKLTSSHFVILRFPLWLVRAFVLMCGPFAGSLTARLARVEESCRDETLDIDEVRRDIGFEPTPLEKGLEKAISSM